MKMPRIFSRLSPLLLIIVLAGTFIFSAKPAKAIPVEDIPLAAWNTLKNLWQKSGSVILNNVLRTTINKFAYDYATYLGSGGKGQKPFFEQVPLEQRLLQAADSGFGQVLEVIGQSSVNTTETETQCTMFYGKKICAQSEKVIKNQGLGIDLCSPDLNILKKITLGLADSEHRPADFKKGKCSWQDFQQGGRWDQALRDYHEFLKKDGGKDFMKSLAGTLDPGVGDIAVALELNGITFDLKTKSMGKVSERAKENGGWLRVQNLIGGKYQNPPGSTARQEEGLRMLQTDGILKYTGDVFVDAANVFINQLALTAFNKLIESIGKKSGIDSGNSDFYGQGSTSGITEIANNASKLLQAQASERSDYDVLGKLTVCDNEQNPGPTDCVITQQFGQAIENQMTIAEAIDTTGGKSPLIDSSKRVGYDEQGNDLNYNNGYPYRSLVILRKYRVLPVGWEVAAQYIKNHPEETKTVNLRKLIECYSPNDPLYQGYYENWCVGLIDPNWVLKLPKLYCGMEGYGPEIIYNSTTPSNIGYCAKKSSISDPIIDCTNKPTSEDCQTDWRTCTKDGDLNCSSGYDKCNFTIGKNISIMRDKNYCADERSCIKEDKNGNCSNYGYCTEEQRRWSFGQPDNNSCEAGNNTCQSFSSETSGNISYLQNTLDYSYCGVNQVGCKKYVATGSAYDIQKNSINWSNSNDFRYFNNKMTECNAENEGCHQFIRIKDDLDSNLIADGNFELSTCQTDPNIQHDSKLPKDKFYSLVKQANAQASLGDCKLEELTSSGYLASPNDYWYIKVASGTVKAGIVKEKYSDLAQSLYIEGYGGIYSEDSSVDNPKTILPAGFKFEDDRFYTLSVNVYVEHGGVKVGFGTAENGQSAIATANNSWQNVIVTYYRPANGAKSFYIEGIAPATKFYIDELKLTVGSADTSYSEYFDKNVIYQKLLPSYLEASCYISPGTDYRFKTENLPDLCRNYTRKCNANEVGCESYTLTENKSIQITGKVKPKDYCPESCLGYNVFVEQPTIFSARNTNYFIPATAKTCSSNSVGCTAFTNLDKLAQGGEAREYYSYLRTCIKPDTASCGEFYTWEGSSDTGYQLRVFSLKKNDKEPASTMNSGDEQSVCNEEIFNKEPSDPGYNYDCREFYSQDGTVSYHLYTRTITCSDDCHPYRREVANQSLCVSGGGTWDTSQAEPRCLHYTIPGEGTACNADEVNCREYTGNIANNIRVVNGRPDSFESTTNPTDGWTGGSVNNTSLELGGHSYLGSDIAKFIGEEVKKDESYSISFLAKSQTGSDVFVRDIYLVNKDNQAAGFSLTNAKIGSDWKIYTFNLDKLNHDVTPIKKENEQITLGEKLVISFKNDQNQAANVYIDNIRLTEIKGRHYLIKDSWVTPDECNQTITGDFSPRYMLGCSQYKDRSGANYNLHGFTQLCQTSAAGCEQMIDTHNSNSQRASTTGGINVPADNIINVVYDKTKQCDEASKGCQRLGLTTVYDTSTIYSDIYLNNDPNHYDESTCSAQAVGCSEWSDASGGKVYFKDPGNMACEWRVRKNSGSGKYEWLKKKIKRCGGTGNGVICVKDEDCTKPQTCQLYDIDDPCNITYNKTLGNGSDGGVTPVPANWAGLCEDEKSGCTEYIDPLSKFSDNLINNPSYQNGGEYWSQSGDAVQHITINSQTIYIIKGAGGDNDAKIKIYCNPVNNGDKMMVLDSNNNFSELTNSETPFTSGDNQSLEFYYQASDPIETSQISCIVTRSNRAEGQSVYLRKAIVSYQLAQNLDRTSPNGIVKPDAGWVLFNERAQNGSSKKSLIYNADTTFETPIQGSSPDSTSTPKNSNVILKVRADRTCAKWLSCLTYTQDPKDSNKKICLDVGLCDKISGNGTCLHFVQSNVRQNQYEGSYAKIANLSGYSKVGYVKNGKSETLDDYYNITSMSQVGENIEILNGGFENNGGWNSSAGKSGAQVLTQPDQIDALGLSPFRTVKDKSLQNFNNLVPEGAGLLKLAPGSDYVQSNSINPALNRRYVMTFYAYAQGNGFKIHMIDTSANPISSFDLVTLGENTVKNKWIKYSFGFKALSTSYKIQLENELAASGNVYVDDLRIDPGLNYRCSDPSKTDPAECNDPAVAGHCSISTSTNCNYDISCPKDETCINSQAIPNYIGSSCRLYAKESSLGCSYIDESNTRHKGIYGYCLETDPKNPAICLLWYPTSRIAGDQTEELPTINFGIGNSLYYCIDARDECNGTVAGFYCDKFIKVNSSYYWYQRMSNGSSFKMPDTTPIGGLCAKSCNTNNDCVSPQSCVSGHCSVLTTKTCGRDSDCLAGQICVGAKPAFPEIPTFWSNNPPTSVRNINFGAKGGGSLTIPEITRNSGNWHYFGSLLSSSSPLTQNEGRITRNGSNLNFIPYYGEISPLNTNLCNQSQESTGRVNDDKHWIGVDTNNKWDYCYVKYGKGDPTGSGNEGYCGNYGNPTCEAKGCGNYFSGPYDFYAQCDKDNDYATCRCLTHYADGRWKMEVYDDNTAGSDDYDNVNCDFAVYDKVQDYKITQGIDEAKDALKRIFINRKASGFLPWEEWNLSGSNYSKNSYFNSPDEPKKCNGTAVGPRPIWIDASSDDDYCYINPVINNFKINGNNGAIEDFAIHPESPYAILSFDTKTDSEQLPIKSIVIDWGYKNAAGEEVTTLGPNLADITGRTITKHFDYWTIRSVADNFPSICPNNTNYCHFPITITITDNWGYGEATKKWYGGLGTFSNHKEIRVYKE